MKFKLNDNLFSVDNFYYGVDLNTDEQYGNYTRVLPNISCWRNKYYYHNNKFVIGQVIFTTNPILSGVPLLVLPEKKDEIEKEIQKIGADHYTPINKENFTELNSQTYYNLKKKRELFMEGLTIGFKANPARWTDDDMIEFLKTYCDSDKAINNGKELLNLYLKFKEPIIESFDIEMEETTVYDDNPNNKHQYKWVSKPKLNSQGQIVAFNVKYK